MFSEKEALFFERRSEEVMGICAWLAPIMNRVHGTKLSESFWIRALSSYALAAYNQKDHFKEESFRYPISFQAISGWAPPNRKQITRDVFVTSLRSLKSTYSPKQIPHGLPRNSHIAFGDRAKCFAADLGATPLSFNWMPYLGRPDGKVRASIRAESQHAGTMLYRNICSHVPRLYVEFFGNLLRLFERADALSIDNIFVEHYGSSFEKLFAAYLSEKGASLIQLQQGGFVGETVDSLEPMTRAGYDFLLTYGWVQCSKDRPFYAPRLEEFRARYLAERVERPSIDLMVVYNSPSPSDALVAHYDECTEALVNQLDRVKYPSFRLRPRAQSRALRITKLPPPFRRVPKEQIDSGHGSIAALCAKSRVVLHWTTPSTNFLECVFVDQPVIAVDTNERPTELLKPFLEFFREVGVLHPGPRSLVSHLNNIEIDSWWRDVTTDCRYAQFKNLFARSKSDWLRAKDRDGSQVVPGEA